MCARVLQHITISAAKGAADAVPELRDLLVSGRGVQARPALSLARPSRVGPALHRRVAPVAVDRLVRLFTVGD